jgi:DNA-binding winged helix-turn-helix (wHTH) protein
VQLAPEQISAHGIGPASAGLVDLWGRLERLAPTTRVGRVVEGPTICILSPNISRRHATIALDSRAVWTIADLQSANGTFVDATRVEQHAPLPDRCRVTFGQVSFFFLEDAARLIPQTRPRAIGATIRAPSEGEAFRPTLDNITEPAKLVMELQQPTGGGGGVLSVGDKSIQLTVAQQDLVAILVERMLEEQTSDPDIRGFVSVDELLDRLSFESKDTGRDSVRQLVRRVRRLFNNAGIGDLIESRHGRGYRLRAVPIMTKRSRR